MKTPGDKIDVGAAIAGFLTLALFLGAEGPLVATSLERHGPTGWSEGLLRVVADPKYR
jgi:hypothetical protein